MPEVIYRPHRIGKIEFDQWQILYGRQVIGYLGKLPECRPTLIIKDLPEDVLAEVNRKAQELLNPEVPPAAVASAIGSESEVPAADAAATEAIALSEKGAGKKKPAKE